MRLYFFLSKYIMVRRNRASRRKRAGVKAGRTYKNLVGTRAEVWHKTAFKTGYGKTKSEGGTALTRVNLVKNKHGRIVSRRMSSTAKRQDRLGRAGWKTRKGVFGSYHVDQGRTRKRRRRRRRRGRPPPRSRRCRHRSGAKKGQFKRC